VDCRRSLGKRQTGDRLFFPENGAHFGDPLHQRYSAKWSRFLHELTAKDQREVATHLDESREMLAQLAVLEPVIVAKL
jgi:hypothetical protein